MIHPRTTGLLAALLLAALLLMGCGGGGGEPSVSQGVHDVLQHELDDALAELEAERDAKRTEAAARRTAEARVTRLETQIGNMNDAASNAEGASLHAQLNAAKAQVTQLEGVIGVETDAASEAESASLHAQLNAANAEVMRLEGEIGAETDRADAAGSLHAQLNHATAEAARLNTLIGSMDDAASEAEGASLHAQLNAANAEVTRLEGELTAANTKVTTLETLAGDATNPAANSLRGQIAKLKTDLATAQGRVTGLESQLGTVRTELEEEEEAREVAEQRVTQAQREAEQRIQEAEQQADASLRADAWLTAMDAMATRVATVQHRPRMSLVFRPAGNYTTGTAAPVVPGGWRRASFTRVTGGGSETAYLYTNIGPPSGKHFWKVYGDGVAEDDWTLALAKPSVFGTPGTARSLYPDGTDVDEDPDDKVGPVSRGGTYDGYSGTFSCTGTADTGCNMAADADNALSSVTGIWTFRASPTAPGVLTEDPEFLYFGIWASEPTSATDGHGFNWIAGGDPADITLFTELTGTAEFNGGAVGRYVLRNQVGQGDRTGTFTATASLTADFDATPSNTIEGRITNFQEGGTALTDWSVYLGSTATAAATLDATGATGTLVATARIGGVPATGVWDATLHGSDNPGHVDFGTGAENVRCPVSGGCPSADLAGVAGWFDAFSDSTPANSDAAIAGAFAASP